MSDHNCFTQLPEAKVKITGIRVLRDYLADHVRFFESRPTVRFTTIGSEVFVFTFNDHKQALQKHFFGYIEDVALNAQNGFYEEAENE